MVDGVSIPAELISEILVRIAVRSLLRLRSVCKLWCRIISDSSFIESHRIRSVNRSDGNFLLVCCPVERINTEKKYRFSMHQWEELGEEEEEEEEEEEANIIATQFEECSYYVSESINGLICFNGPPIKVCNLSTRECLIPPLPPPPSRLGFSSSRCSLGFDPCSNTYKILRMLSFKDPVYEKFEILTLGSNTWREVVDVPADSSYSDVLQYRRSVCVDGSLYWNTTRLLKGILAFDLAEERFRVVPPPPGWTSNSSLARLDGRLAMVDYSCLSSRKTMRIWMMMMSEEEEDTNKYNWSIEQRIVFPSLWKLGSVVIPGQPPREGLPSGPFYYSETALDGEFVISPETTSGEEAHIYVSCFHLESGSFNVKSLTKPRAAQGMLLWRPGVSNYVESLVSLTQVINSYKP